MTYTISQEERILIVSYWVTYCCAKFRQWEIRDIMENEHIEKLMREELLNENIEALNCLIERLEYFNHQYNIYTTDLKNYQQ